MNIPRLTKLETERAKRGNRTLEKRISELEYKVAELEISLNNVAHDVFHLKGQEVKGQETEHL